MAASSTIVSTIGHLVAETVREWKKDQVPQLGAALAYYTTVSLAPMLVVAVAMLGWLLGRDAASSSARWSGRSAATPPRPSSRTPARARTAWPP
jgi:uncharacterized BrkB/YihY/UPF0761 family membrane protein